MEQTGKPEQIRLWVLTRVLFVGLNFCIFVSAARGWESFSDESTLEVLTVDQAGKEHWSKFWLVVIDRQLYLRLGTRGAARIEGNTKKPFVSVKIAGQRFDQVRVVPAPEKAETVAAAMAKKYWSDLIIRWFPHPLTVRLERDLGETSRKE